MVAALPATTGRLKRALRLVPGLGDGGAPLQLARLGGGSVNELWRVDTAAGRFVVRLAGDAAVGAHRRRELRVHMLAARHALAPPVLACELASGTLVSPWIGARAWRTADFLRPGYLRALARRIARLQELPVPGRTRFAPGRLAEAYARRAAGVAGGRRPRKLAGLVTEIERAHRFIVGLQLGAVIVHGDLGAGNVLGTRPPWLIDWEYAQFTSPCYEYGALLALHPGCSAHLPVLPALSGLSPRDYRAALHAAAQVYGNLNRLWHAARAGRD